MTQGAAERISELSTPGVCEDPAVSGLSMLDPDSRNKAMDTGRAGGTDRETWLLFCTGVALAPGAWH